MVRGVTVLQLAQLCWYYFQLYWPPSWDTKGWFLDLSSPLYCEFQRGNSLDQLGFNCAQLCINPFFGAQSNKPNLASKFGMVGGWGDTPLFTAWTRFHACLIKIIECHQNYLKVWCVGLERRYWGYGLGLTIRGVSWDGVLPSCSMAYDVVRFFVSSLFLRRILWNSLGFAMLRRGVLHLRRCPWRPPLRYKQGSETFFSFQVLKVSFSHDLMTSSIFASVIYMNTVTIASQFLYHTFHPPKNIKNIC